MRALRGHRLRTALSLLGVAIGVAAVVMLTALGEGARRYVLGQFAAVGTNMVIVLPGKTQTTGAMPGMGGVPNDLTLDDALAVARGVRQVEKMAPMVVGTETVAFGERRRQVALIGSSHEALEVRRLSIAQGRFLPPFPWDRGAAVVVLGSNLARELFPGTDPVGQVVRVGDWRMRVIGVLAPRGQQLGIDMDEVVVVPVATAMKMLNRSGLFRLVIQVRSHAELESAKAAVLRAADRAPRRGGRHRDHAGRGRLGLQRDPRRADDGARRDRRHLAGGGRHRDHERDAGLGLRADARGRPAEGARRRAAARSWPCS